MTDPIHITHYSAQIDRLIHIMARLRTPETGCPWDLAQTSSSIIPYTIEEAYEVADAIETGDKDQLCEELGDLLLQVIFHARMAEEDGSFSFDDVARAISDKMVRRHPHIFGDRTADDTATVRANWEDIKAAERTEKAAKQDLATTPSLLDDISRTLPAMVRAVKLQKRAARAGFDWSNLHQVINKLHEETEELRTEWDAPTRNTARIKDEVGDILFVAANLARTVGVEPETALIGCNNKFERRFRAVEAGISADGLSLEEATLEDMSRHWDNAKIKEKSK